MDKKEWYIEYEIQVNRPGLLGDVASLLGMLSIDIVTINGVQSKTRGLLLRCERDEQIERLCSILRTMEHIKVKKVRPPRLRDRLAIRHGRYLERDEEDKKIYRFVREDLGILVDFIAEIIKQGGHKMIGIRGMPRVGKTESIVAASVCANKRWLFISSTLIKQTVRTELLSAEYSNDNVYIIDGAVSIRQQNDRHWQLIREVMRIPTPKIIEHPDMFVRDAQYKLTDFDYIIEIRNHDDEEITYEIIDKNLPFSEGMFGI